MEFALNGEPAKLPYVYGLSYIYRSHGSQGLVHISCIARTYPVGCKLHGTQVVRTNTTFWLGQKGGRNKLLSVRHRHFSTQRSKPCICAKPKSIASLLSENIAGTLRLSSAASSDVVPVAVPWALPRTLLPTANSLDGQQLVWYVTFFRGDSCIWLLGLRCLPSSIEDAMTSWHDCKSPAGNQNIVPVTCCRTWLLVP